jgi:zinc protease
MRKTNRLLILFAAALVAFLLSAGQAAAMDIQRRVLDNGLIVLHVKRDNIPVMVATLLVRAGQADEPADKAGLASLTASLLSEGTSTRTSEQVSEDVEFIGANLSASAGSDYTTVSLSVLKRHMDKGFELFSDVLLHPAFQDSEVSRKKSQFLAAIQQNQEDPDYLVTRAFDRAIFGGNPYGHPSEGTPESLPEITRGDILSFYQTHYVPNGSVLALVGDISEDEVDSFIQRYLKDWNGGPPPGRQLTAPPPTESRTITIDRDITQANILMGHLGVTRGNPDYYALSVMNYIFGGGGFSSRLMESVRDRMGLAYSIYSAFVPDKDDGEFFTSVQTKNASARTVIDETVRQMRLIASKEVTEQELADAKSYLIGSFPRRLETLGRIAGFLVAVEYYGLGMDYPEKYPQYIERVTRQDVLRVAKKYLHPDRLTMVVVGNIKQTGIAENPAKQ